jgi:hypothetical protein
VRSWGVLVNAPIERILERRRYILFGHEGQRDVLVVGTESRQGCHDNSVLQLHIAQLEGLEEVRRHAGIFRGFEAKLERIWVLLQQV